MQTLVEQAAAIADGRQSSLALIEAARSAAAAAADLNPLAWVDWPAAQAQARQLDAEGRCTGCRSRSRICSM
jgi:Asp-tRNA(Asn)/Glu-tRNA(Gln) amidotransferase A subunit family amidase